MLLLLAGVTVYAPLRKHLKTPGMQVAVLGVGGLGHLAVQFASKMGAAVRKQSPHISTSDAYNIAFEAARHASCSARRGGLGHLALQLTSKMGAAVRN
jgi:D-arabinose 1-dehydrogenase-like Zn-dependent alcohol dehydrogenase